MRPPRPNTTADLVVIDEEWGSPPRATQHLMLHLAHEHRLLWIDASGLTRPAASNALGGLIAKGRDLLKPDDAQRDRTSGFVVMAPPSLSCPTTPRARERNRQAFRGAVGRGLTRAGFHRPVLWTSVPAAVDAVGCLDERAVIYFRERVPEDATTRALEIELMSKADLILAATPALARDLPETKTRLLPAGVDLDLFVEEAPPAAEIVASGPVAGYRGPLGPWLDIDLLAETARLLPHWRFLLIGSREPGFVAPLIPPNVSVLGERKLLALPGYLQHWTASLMPHRPGDTAEELAAPTLLEYLAAGRPVVATESPVLDGYRDLVEVVDDPEAMASALEDLRNDPPYRVHQRRDRVAESSWEARAAMVEQWIIQILQ